MAQQQKPIQEWPNDVFTLGLFSYQLDGWADLIEGKGDKRDQVQEQVFSLLTEREIPDVKIKKRIARPTYFSPLERRKYLVTSTAPGASTAIYIGEHGKDLFVSWRTFVKPVLNWILLLAIFGISSSISFLIFVAALIFLQSNGFGYFGNVFLGALQSGFVAFVMSLVAQIALILFLGAQIKEYLFAYFFVEPTYFDIDDVTAMGLAAHDSILRALDKAGIESANLRLKRDFKTNRRGDTV